MPLIAHQMPESPECVDFVAAVARQEWGCAETLITQLGENRSEATWSAIARFYMQRERWGEAWRAFQNLKKSDSQQQMQMRLCRNLESLQAHRPEIYRLIADAEVGDAYRIQASKSGLPTIVATRSNGSRVLLAGGDNPEQAAQRVRESLKPQNDKGMALGILSIGDGYVLNVLVRNPPVLFMDRRQTIFLIEPDARLILACMLIHDLSGEGGPIESPQVYWMVGKDWADQFSKLIIADRYLPFPQITVKAGIDPAPMESVISATLEKLAAIDARCTQDIQQYYGGRTSGDFAQALKTNAKERPRVLLITTRFSTVLQHSTRDAAEAFEQLGCETHLIIEPTSHHGLTRLGMRRTLAEFKPDLIFQIDHNRFEHVDLFPPNIPFVNWIQDLLPHLMRVETGRKIGIRDFVLTPSLQRWVDEYAYPKQQCIEFRKLTRIAKRPLAWISQSNHVVYVSNWSQSPERICEELVHHESGDTRRVIETACQRMIATYMAGDAMASQGDVRRLLMDVMRECQVQADEGLIRHTTTRLFDRLNNLLFRQQGLRWAMQACKSLDLNLRIYGKGWDAHPEFASHAAGEIAYGGELENLTRSAGINLVLEPFVCIAHQRFLDAVAAGGFCLVRSNPANQTIQSMIDLLATVPDAANTMQLQQQLGGAFQEDLSQTIAANQSLDVSPGAVDHVAIVYQMQQAGFLPEKGEFLPHLQNISFNDPASMEALLKRFSQDAACRGDIARRQRTAIESRYSYAAGMKRVMEWVSQRLTDEPGTLGRAA